MIAPVLRRVTGLPYPVFDGEVRIDVDAIHRLHLVGLAYQAVILPHHAIRDLELDVLSELAPYGIRPESHAVVPELIDPVVPEEADQAGLLPFKILKYEGISLFQEGLLPVAVVDRVKRHGFDLGAHRIDIVLLPGRDPVIHPHLFFLYRIQVMGDLSLEKALGDVVIP